jgi:hypothetical protein
MTQRRKAPALRRTHRRRRGPPAGFRRAAASGGRERAVPSLQTTESSAKESFDMDDE